MAEAFTADESALVPKVTFGSGIVVSVDDAIEWDFFGRY
jgi:hypothetical protein